MSDIPDVSVIIPVFNSEEYLPRCLESVAKQTLKSIEAIVIDDGSPGDCPGAVERCRKEYPELEIRYVPHGGNRSLLQTRVTGVVNARGRYVLALDSDDWISPTVCERAVETAENHHADIVQYDMYIARDFEEKDITPNWTNREFKVLRDDDVRRGFFDGFIFWNLAGKLVRREFFAGVLKKLAVGDGVYINHSEDLCLVGPLLLNAKCYVYDDDAGRYYYYVNPQSLTKNVVYDARRWRTTCENDQRTRKIIFDYLDRADAPAEIREGMEQKFFMIFKWLFHEMRALPPNLLFSRFAFMPGIADPNMIARYLLEENFITRETFPLLRILAEAAPVKGRPEKIRHVGIILGRIGYGGSERVAVLLAEALAEAGYEVTVFTHDTCPQEYPLSGKVNRIHLSWVPAERWEQIQHHIAGLGIDLCTLLDHWTDLMMQDVACVRLTGSYVVAQEHNAFFFPFYPGITHIYKMRQEIYRCVDALTCLSRCNLAWWRASGMEKSLYMPNPLTFDPDRATRSDGRSKNIIFVGRICRVKGLCLLPHIVSQLTARVPGVKLIVLGRFDNDAAEHWFMNECRRLGVLDAIEIKGQVADVDSYYRESSVHIMPSYVEGKPMTLMEAKAHGVPSVLFEMSYLEAAGEGDGCVMVGKEDVDGMVEAVARLLEDRPYWEAMSAKALASLEQFRPVRVTGKWEVLFFSILRDRVKQDFAAEQARPDSMLPLTMREFLHGIDYYETCRNEAARAAINAPEACECAVPAVRQPAERFDDPGFALPGHASYLGGFKRTCMRCFPYGSLRRRGVMKTADIWLWMCVRIRRCTDFLYDESRSTAKTGHPVGGYFAVFDRFVRQALPPDSWRRKCAKSIARVLRGK